MSKEHDKWIPLKKKIDSFEEKMFFHEREVWWCSIGTNVGHEQDGKGEDFRRPVLIVRKFDSSLCWVVPFTTSLKEDSFRLYIIFKKGISQVLLSQLKLIDEKRLIGKMGRLSSFQFGEIKKALARLLLKDIV